MRRRRAARLARWMTVAFLLVMLFEVPSLAANVWVTVAISVGVVLVTWVLGNLVRHRRPLTPPERITWVETTVFLAVPSLAVLLVAHDPLILDGEEIPGPWVALAAAIVMFAGQLILFAVVNLLAYSGVMALVPWLWRRMVSSFMAGGAALGRTLPLLLGVVGFLFFTGELWQAFGGLSPWAYLLAIGLFIFMGWLFLHTRGLDLDALARFDDDAELSRLVQGTPLQGGTVDLPAVCPLTRDQERNLRLVMVISKLTIATVVGLAVFVFFLVFGVFTVNAQVVQAWTQAQPHVLLQWGTERYAYALTLQHLRVSGFLAVFSGFYFAVVSATDPTLREGLRDNAEDDVRQACAARLVALRLYPEPSAVEQT